MLYLGAMALNRMATTLTILAQAITPPGPMLMHSIPKTYKPQQWRKTTRGSGGGGGEGSIVTCIDLYIMWSM